MTLACRATMFIALLAGAAPVALASEPIPPNYDLLLAGAAAGALASEPIPPSYELVDTVSVPPDGSIAMSTKVLTEGVAYVLVALGTDPGAGDAEYDAAGQDRCGPEMTPTDLGVVVSMGIPVSPIPVSPASYLNDKLPFWGPFDPGHVYSVAATGRGARLSVSYRDCTYDDNRGGLTVWVFGPRSYSIPKCEVVFTQPTFVDGEAVTARLIRLSNNDTNPVAVEFKLWLRMPGFGTVALVNVGADSQFQLPANYNKEFNNVPLFTVTPDFPRGTYELACAVTGPATGEVFSRRVDRFGIR